MGRIVMKEAPDVDFYVEWSSIVEAPTFGGDRATALAYLQGQQHSAENTPEQRLERCDRTGTTSLWVAAAGLRDRHAEEGAWDDDSFIYQQQGTVTRADIFPLTRRLLADNDADVSDLVRPFDDDDETTP